MVSDIMSNCCDLIGMGQHCALSYLQCSILALARLCMSCRRVMGL